jgi:hypothetical protein
MEDERDVPTAPNKIESNNRAAVREASWEKLGDFTTTIRVLPISALALAIGMVAALEAFAPLRL